MVEILRFDEALLHRTRTRPSKTSESGDSFSFWPEVSCGLWVSGTRPPVDPANAQKTVLSEILLILSATVAVVAAVSFLVGAPPVM